MCAGAAIQTKWFQRWDVITFASLIFTAIVAPFEVAFLKTNVDGLFFVNRFVDAVFVIVSYIAITIALAVQRWAHVA